MSPRAGAPEPPARTGAAHALRAFVSSVDHDGPLLVLALGLVGLGVALRVVAVDFPHWLTWDEHHFVENARNYIAHRHDWNDHPPLGKLLIVPWILALGDVSRSWRLSSVLFGLASVLVARCIAVTLYRDRRAGWLAAAFLAGDGFLISYSRTALLDGVLTAFVLFTLYAAVRARGALGVAVAAGFIGCAASVKTSGFGLGLPVLILVLVRARKILSLQTALSVAALAMAPLVYTAIFSYGLWLVHEPYGIVDVWIVSFRLLANHNLAQSFSHPLTSHWYTWFLPVRPITLRYDIVAPHAIRVLSTLGNPVLWWSTTVAFFGSASLAVGALLRRLGSARSGAQAAGLGRFEQGTVVLFSFALTMLLPWVIGKRDSYIYHYLPSYACLLIVVAGATAAVYRKKRLVALGFTAVVCLVSVFYAPVWGQLEMTKRAFNARLFVPKWR
jgi:dolichyl-phosphate-mannose--protein O-mannosyl transferase